MECMLARVKYQWLDTGTIIKKESALHVLFSLLFSNYYGAYYCIESMPIAFPNAVCCKRLLRLGVETGPY